MSVIVAALLALFGAVTPTAPAVRLSPYCPAGEVVVHGDDPTPCDLRGNVNTLTVLDITPTECDDIGGVWIYEACENADF